ncbi:NFX1-type zinc finger-containing protein 1-like isoform X2 [Montipora capricornis]|uniref:NFX1-type zinc finger-containing protein 1-like isoform X2 n=1 Tax=Montipora capricornis TaxID=246305 RepID=UPI0035F1BA90
MDDWEALGAVPREQGRHTGLINRPHSLGSFGSGTVGGRGRGRGRGWHGGRARGRGGRSGEGRPYQVRLGFKALEELDTKAPDEIILDLTSTRCFPATESLLQQSGMMDDMVVLITSILAKACACSSKEYLIKLLNLLPKSPFFALHLRTFLNRISACRMPATNIATFLNNVIKIMNELLRRFPNCYADLPVAELYCGVMFWSNTEQIDGNQVDGNSLLKDAEELFKLRTQKAEDLKKREEEKQSRRRPRRDAGLHDDDDPPDDFRTLSVIPTQADVLSGERPFLRRNKVDGSYNSSEHYLDVQFRLLREDFVRPLREGIAQLLERIGSPKIGALQDIRVYKDVQILYPICTSNGLQYKVKFDNTRLRNVRWENSKRLIFGSLMCLSKDKFESFVFATVANRDVKDLKQGIVQMQFINLSDMLRLESGDVYQMVESTVYFEAYRHILEGLKEVDPARLPLQKYIVNCEKDVEAPAYLRNRFRERVTFDLTPIMRGESRNVGPSPSGSSLLRLRFASLNLRDNSRGKGTNVPILNLAAWPTAEDLELDNSQYRAIKMALTKEFAVIQGPPGTGKTYLGLKIANVLLHNKSKWDTGTEHLDGDIDERYLLSERRPILVVCYTNHALDQFLEGIHKLHPQGIVRVGGRSQSEVMQACSLSELKHKMHKEKKIPLHIRRAYYDAHQEMEHTTASLENAAEDLKRCHENVIHEDDIRRRAPSMTDTLYHSLKADLLQADSRNSVMLHWLQLSWNPGVGASAQPVAVFPLNQMVQGLERISRGNVATFSRRTAWALDQNRSVQLLGSPDSYIEIPNLPGSDLDTRTSITLLMHVFPSGNRGSIISFQENGLGVQIWQEGMVDGKGILTARFTWRDFSQPPGVSKAVLNMNAWNFIGASYDHDSGFARLWHQGNVVETKFIGRKMELATQFSIRIGALADSGRGDCFRGMVADLHIFAESLGRDAVRAVGGIVSQAGAEAEEEQHDSFGEEEEEEAEDQDVLYEAAAMQDMRVLDNDDVRVFRAKQVAALKGRLKVVHIDLGGSVDPDGFQLNNPKRLRRKLKSTIIQELSKKDVMPDGRVRMIRNVWSLNIKDRWRLYRRWVADISESYRHTISLYQEQFEAGAKKMKDIRNLEDFEILKNADVVGLTTTGAAKFRRILQRLKPRITIVEEAAEVLESHIVTSLTPGCQHLILIGDHQQLRPNPTVFDLAKHYNLDVSLFERMVNNGMPFERLRLQHRMRPEISKMLEHIYVNPKLENHESVLHFENIKGVARNMFFVDHDQGEDFLEEGKSRSNEHEAKFLASLCRYLILQGYDREKITVLTAYTGQLIQLKNEMPKDFFRGVRVCAVDNFQGEENDIILLSLVRSNEEGKIGFLQTENRVCVALSRAKKGFFCIGNISLLKEKSELWYNIISDMEERGNVGKALTLTCQNHPQNVIHAARADDFRQAPEGGCSVPCNTRLECGHVCEMACHPTDPEHKEYRCNKPCAKSLCKLDHKCKKRCFQECGPCLQPVQKFLNCGHLQKVPCFKNPSEVKCRSPCEQILPCGHGCQNECSEGCTVRCAAKVKKTWPCGHENVVKCHENPLHIPCNATCGVVLKCEHRCAGTCSSCLRGRVHQPCRSICTRILFCGHSCSEPCTKNCPPCKKPCGNSCKHSKCKQKCGEPCKPCNEPCIWKCQHHKCTKLCSEPCNRKRCDQPCKKRLPCKHLCIGLCGENCPKKCRVCHKDEVTEIFFGTEDDPNARFVELADCGHFFEVEMMDNWMDQAQQTDDGKAVDVQLKCCPKCSTPIRTSLRYGNIIKKILADFEEIKKKILLGEEQRRAVVSRLRLKARKIVKFPEDQGKLMRALEHSSLTDEQVNVYENQISFLRFLQELKDKIEKGIDDDSERATKSHLVYVPLETKEDIQIMVEELRKRVMETRARFSEQELEELNEEMYRTQLAVDVKLLKMQIKVRGISLDAVYSSSLDRIQKRVDSEKAIGKDDRERYTTRIEMIRRRHNLTVFYQDVTRQEKDLIVKAMGLTQGHWFKCPKGHIYCITECGGAMEEGRCPECGSSIGGRNHQLRADNRLASEMDGARYAAFSDLANINNFDPRDFM